MWRVLQAQRGMGFAARVCLSPSPCSALLSGGCRPLHLCGLVVGWGFLRVVCLFFLWFFMVGAEVGLVNSVGLRGRSSRWRMVMNKGVVCAKSVGFYMRLCGRISERAGLRCYVLYIWSCAVLGSVCGVRGMRVGVGPIPC